jgi:D-alanyl-D-alanine carboxypeptidase
LALAAGVAGLLVSGSSADARHFRRVVHVHSIHFVSRQAQSGDYAPLGASIVVDGNSGEVLSASNPDASRHPASLTKIMTLYLLFARLDAGKLKLDTPLKVSEHASEQAPTKLGLRPGQTIAVEDAIKAVVTKSANDAAVAIAENLAGDEAEFARLMTQQARTLGMSRTTYVNASGLPDDDQVTTARDQALLGRAIQEHFPRYYKYFSTEEFVYHGHAMRNHNHLLGVVGGLDGIKTGYTRASGFNLVTSVHRDGRYIVAVVLGGHTAHERDARMRELISNHIRQASIRHTTPAVAEKTAPHRIAVMAAAEKDVQTVAPAPNLIAKPAGKSAEPAATPQPDPATVASADRAGAGDDTIQPLVVRTISYHAAPAQTAPLTPLPQMTPAAAPATQIVTPDRMASASANAGPDNTIVVASNRPSPIATLAESARPDLSRPEISKSGRIETDKPGAAKLEAAKPETRKPETTEPDVNKSEAATPHGHAHGGWLIQIGAFDGEDEAKQRLNAALAKAPALGSADGFTERVQKGVKSLFRARFASFDRQTAEATCKRLKRSDIDCMAVKD